MSGDLELGPAARRAGVAVRELARAAVPEGEDAFRERLKRDFATGRIGESRALELGAPGARLDRGRREWLDGLRRTDI